MGAGGWRGLKKEKPHEPQFPPLKSVSSHEVVPVHVCSWALSTAKTLPGLGSECGGGCSAGWGDGGGVDRSLCAWSS